MSARPEGKRPPEDSLWPDRSHFSEFDLAIEAGLQRKRAGSLRCEPADADAPSPPEPPRDR